MDYVKRDICRDEVDILINRIVVLQEQEKEYTDLWDKIEESKKILKSKNTIIDGKKKEIEEQRAASEKLAQEIIGLKENKLKEEREILKLKSERTNEVKSIEKQREISDNFAKWQSKQLSEMKIKKDNIEQEITIAYKELEEAKSKLTNWQSKILEAIENNETTIIKQKKEIEENILKIQELRNDIQEIESEYTKSLEKYIVTI